MFSTVNEGRRRCNLNTKPLAFVICLLLVFLSTDAFCQNSNANTDSLATRRASVWQHALNLSPEQTRQLVQLEKKWMAIMQEHKTKQRENPKESKSPFDNNRSTLDADFRAILTAAQAQRYDSIRQARVAALQASGKYPTSKQ